MTISEAQLLQWVALWGWSFVRIGAMFLVMPIFSAQAVSVRVRAMIAAVVTLAVVPALPVPELVSPFSFEGMMTTLQQVGIGVLMGFCMQMVFSAVMFAGQSIAYSMGLGFASMIDPQTGVQVPVIAQFYLIVTTFLFLGTDSHLVLVGLLIESFKTLPIAPSGLTSISLWEILRWSSRIFAGGLLMALPLVCILLLMNMALGIAGRAAPQLNIFSVGFSITILAGLWLMAMTLANILEYFSLLLDDSFRLVNLLF